MIQRLLIPEIREVLQESVAADPELLTRHEAKNIAGHLDTHDPEAEQRRLVRPSVEEGAAAVRDHYHEHSRETKDMGTYATAALPAAAAELMDTIENPTAGLGILELIAASVEEYRDAYRTARDEGGESQKEARASALGATDPYERYGAVSDPGGYAPEDYGRVLEILAEDVTANAAEDTWVWVQEAEDFLSDFAARAARWRRDDIELTAETIADIRGMVDVFNLWSVATPDDIAPLSLAAFLDGQDDALEVGQPLPPPVHAAMVKWGRLFHARTRAAENKPEKSRAFLNALADRYGTFTPHWQSEFAKTFVHVKRVGPEDANWRVYVSVQPEAALDVFRYTLDEMVGHIEGVKSSKVAGPGEIGMRADTIVIYLSEKSARAAVIQKLEEYQSLPGGREQFGPDLPLGTKHKLPGVSAAQEPGAKAAAGGAHSYGSVLAVAIKNAIRKLGPHAADKAIVQQVLVELEALGFDREHLTHFTG